jgi:hypothetical protein
MVRLLVREIFDRGVTSDGSISASIEPPDAEVAVVVDVGA